MWKYQVLRFIVKLKMVFQDYSNIFFLSEYLEGTSLDSILKKTFKEEETSSFLF